MPAYLYAGGFQNFNPRGTVAAGTTDVAQLVNYPGSATLSLYGEPDATLPTILQWNDPDDTTIPSISADPIFTDTGTLTYPINTSTGVAFTHALVAGQEYYLYLNPSADRGYSWLAAARRANHGDRSEWRRDFLYRHQW